MPPAPPARPEGPAKLLLLAGMLLALGAPAAAAEPEATAPAAAADPAPAAASPEAAPPAPPADELSAEEIYRRYSRRKNRESFQKVRILSRDPGGSEQLSQFDLRIQDARDDDGAATRGARFRTRIDVHDPFDMRHTKYLIITKESGPDDEFVYQPSARRVRRVDLTNTSFLGTDYQFGDFAVENVEQAERVRLPDETVDGTPVYVIENTFTGEGEVEYRKTILYLEQEHYLPLRIRSWDDFGVEVKEMTAPASGIRQFGDVWITTESTVHDLLQKTTSTLYIDEFDPSPGFKRATFTSGRLGRGK